MVPPRAGNDNHGISNRVARSLVPSDSLASFMAPGFLTVLSLTIAFLVDKLASAASGEPMILVALVAYLTMALPTLGLAAIIALYKRPLAAATGMALVNLVWYTLALSGGDTYNYMDWPSSLMLVLVEELLNMTPGPAMPIIAALVSLATWLALGHLIVRLTRIIRGGR
ncbi:MAG: hypothetical protein GSR84_00775 [Desulfurococcales archaeon]|nr:hypothetical protein [Desulfurococcales archaeon]